MNHFSICSSQRSKRANYYSIFNPRKKELIDCIKIKKIHSLSSISCLFPLASKPFFCPKTYSKAKLNYSNGNHPRIKLVV